MSLNLKPKYGTSVSSVISLVNFGDVDVTSARHQTERRPIVHFAPIYPVDVKYLFLFQESQKIIAKYYSE